MTIENANRRESDRVPMGVECALPWAPGPSRAARQPKPKRHVMRTLAFLLLALVLILGAWHVGRGIYTHVKQQLAQAFSGGRT